ncbi:hypothetical protein F4802DRAFT_351052 [Xylaria palmicola]|nr:hypothetical protein F4802DRAFT_351052 [Xylaria palmicola]
MANLPSQHPALGLHLTDRTFTPLITSARAEPQLEHLTALAHAAQAAHESALRLGLGVPQRIMVEHHGDGPVLLQTFLSPHPPPANTAPEDEQAARSPSPSPSTSATNGHPQHAPGETPLDQDQGQGSLAHAAAAESVVPVHGDPATAAYRHLLLGHDAVAAAAAAADIDDLDEDPDAPPMLVGIVVAARAGEALDVRRAAARLERVGREIQGRWAELQGQGESG